MQQVRSRVVETNRGATLGIHVRLQLIPEVQRAAD
jgi:hypothetical protein